MPGSRRLGKVRYIHKIGKTYGRTLKNIARRNERFNHMDVLGDCQKFGGSGRVRKLQLCTARLTIVNTVSNNVNTLRVDFRCSYHTHKSDN